MNSKWELYESLIDPIPLGIPVTNYFAGPIWSYVRTELGCGVAMTMSDRSRPSALADPLAKPLELKDLAALSMSWNFAEASIGMAAINAWYNSAERIADNPGLSVDETEGKGFDKYLDRIRGSKVGMVGHFAVLDKLADICDLTVFERRLRPGDYPDPAVEYLFAEQDFVFITASAFVNKTMPRLLELASNIPTVIIGPSTPLAPSLASRGVTLSGLIVDDPEYCDTMLRGLGDGRPTRAGHYVTVKAN